MGNSIRASPEHKTERNLRDMTETLNGLLTQKPGRYPQQGEIKLFTIEHRKGKSGKPYIKIKNSTAENGGQPYRILSAEKTDFVDQHGNISFSVEVEATTAQPTAFANARATMQQGEPEVKTYDLTPTPTGPVYKRVPETPVNEPESSVHTQQGEDGVTATRKHLMQTSNLMVLCIKAADYVALQLPEVAHTSEQFAGILGQLFKEAYSRRTTDGVNWWSYSDLMPDKPLPVNGGKHATTASSKPKNVCTCENTDGDNPLCPVHST